MAVPARIPVSVTVYDALRADILARRLAPGDGIPSERVLSERFGVNRHAVREAVKRLQQAGLVQVSHGGATRVLDWRVHGGLELLTDLPASGDMDAARAGYELRACLAAEIAARAAERATAQDLLLLDDRARALHGADGAAARLDAYRRLWDVLVDATANIAYRLAYNSLLAGEDAMVAVALVFLREELHDTEAIDALVAAVHQRDDGAARAHASTLTAHTIRAMSVAEEVTA